MATLLVYLFTRLLVYSSTVIIIFFPSLRIYSPLVGFSVLVPSMV